MSPALAARLEANRWVQQIFDSGECIFGAEGVSETKTNVDGEPVAKASLPEGWLETLGA